RAIDGIEDMLPRETAIVHITAHGIVELGAIDELVARDVLKHATDHLLGGAQRIHVSQIEEVDAEVDGLLENRTRGSLVEHPRRPGRRAESHAPEAQL